MDRVSRKVTSIAIAAVLCFWMAFPVSSFVKPQKAEAIAPAIPIAVLFGTAALVGGVAVAGTSAAQYNANLQSVCNGFEQATAQWSQSWSDYVSAQGSFNNAMNSCVTEDGNIRLQTLSDAGFFDSLNSYTAYCIEHGTMVHGATSKDAVREVFLIDGLEIHMSNTPSAYYANALNAAKDMTNPIWLTSTYSNNGRYETYSYLVVDGLSSLQFEGVNADYNRVYYRAAGTSAAIVTQRVWLSDGHLSDPFSNGVNLGQQQSMVISDGYFNSSLAWTYDGAGIETTNQTGDTMAVVGDASSAASGLISSGASVRPFEPTAQQIENGFDSSAVIEAINSGTAETNAGIQDVISTLTGTIGGLLNDVKTGVNGLESAIGTAISTGATSVIDGVSSAINTGVNTLSTVLNDIKTASQTIEQTLGGAISTTLTGIATGIAGVGTTLGDIWGGLQGWYTDWLAWVGTTPLGALIAQVIAALNAGVLDLAGLLELVNAGVLDLSTAIELVQTAVQDGVTEITSAIEGIQFPSFEWPKVEGTPQVALPPGDMRSSMDAVIQDKAPFAYMYSFGEGIQSLEYSQEPKFRMRQTFDIVADEVEIDINAEPWLNRDIGGVTIAQLLRASVTLTLCMGLLYGAYKTAMAAVKAG